MRRPIPEIPILAIFVLLLTGATTVFVSAATIRVPQDQPTIQAGIDAAAGGDLVLVAPGTYTGQGNRDLDFLGKAITVRSASGPADCVIDCQGSDGDPHRGVLFQSGEGPDSVLQGVTIRNGNTFFPGSGEGAGILCLNGSSPTVRDNVLTGNHSEWFGGAICCRDGSSPVIAGNTISGNGVWGEGGGISCSGASPSITGNTITGNSADFGGGICVSQPLAGGVQITGNRIADNSASEGGINAEEATISGNTISGNTAWAYGGGILGGSVISGNVIEDNGAAFGGGVWGGGLIVNNLITLNQATLGGALLCYAAEIRGNTITANSAGSGGALYSVWTGCSAADNLFWGNAADSGKEIYLADNYRFGGRTPIRLPRSGAARSAELALSYSSLEGGQASVFVEPASSLTWGPGMLDADPLFIAGPGGDYYLSQVSAGQPADSPCLDAGSTAASDLSVLVFEGPASARDLTTRTDGLTDAGILDLGYHHRDSLLQAGLTCLPAAGTLPLDVLITAAVTNRHAQLERRGAARVDVSLGNGLHYSKWRSGYMNLHPGETKFFSWTEHLAGAEFVGLNSARILLTDVTPSPYNQPPYPPFHDSDTESCTVTLAE